MKERKVYHKHQQIKRLFVNEAISMGHCDSIERMITSTSIVQFHLYFLQTNNCASLFIFS